MDEDNSARTPRVSPSDEHSMEAELRALLERATREPWDDLGHAIVSPRGDAELGNWMVAERVRWEEDRRLIVAMRNHLPALLSALAGMREALKFYADIDNPDDDGARARAALAEGNAAKDSRPSTERGEADT